MPKYKKVSEGILDSLVAKIFTQVGKGMESATIKKLQKTDPKLAKHMIDVRNKRKEIEKYSYSPIYNPFYKVTEGDFIFDKIFSNIISNYENCKNLQEKCDLKLKDKLKKYGNNI